MRTHEIYGEVAEVTATTTKTKQNGDSYKIATIIIKQFDMKRSELALSGYNEVAKSMSETIAGDLVIVEFEVDSKKNKEFWNTYAKAKSVAKISSPSQPVIQVTESPINESGIVFEESKPAQPEVNVPKPNVQSRIPLMEESEFEDMLAEPPQEPQKDSEPKPDVQSSIPLIEASEFEDLLAEISQEPQKEPEPEKHEVVFPSVMRKKEQPEISSEQIAEAIQKLGPKKFAELLLNAQK
jgi:ribosomal protein S6